jgi:hypothetical protein
MRKLLIALALFVALGAADAAVVRLAPDFTFLGAGNRAYGLKSLRGQAVVLLITDSPDRRAFRKQLRYLQEIYQQFASKKVVFIAALKHGTGPIESNIPFVVADNGAAVAGAYGAAEDDFTIAIIGTDGNVDYQTTKVCRPERVRDVIQNAFPVQTGARK